MTVTLQVQPNVNFLLVMKVVPFISRQLATERKLDSHDLLHGTKKKRFRWVPMIFGQGIGKSVSDAV